MPVTVICTDPCPTPQLLQVLQFTACKFRRQVRIYSPTPQLMPGRVPLMPGLALCTGCGPCAKNAGPGAFDAERVRLPHGARCAGGAAWRTARLMPGHSIWMLRIPRRRSAQSVRFCSVGRAGYALLVPSLPPSPQGEGRLNAIAGLKLPLHTPRCWLGERIGNRCGPAEEYLISDVLSKLAIEQSWKPLVSSSNPSGGALVV